jgi:hypothetical protein
MTIEERHKIKNEIKNAIEILLDAYDADATVFFVIGTDKSNNHLGFSTSSVTNGKVSDRCTNIILKCRKLSEEWIENTIN